MQYVLQSLHFKQDNKRTHRLPLLSSFDLIWKMARQAKTKFMHLTLKKHTHTKKTS